MPDGPVALEESYSAVMGIVTEVEQYVKVRPRLVGEDACGPQGPVVLLGGRMYMCGGRAGPLGDSWFVFQRGGFEDLFFVLVFFFFLIFNY